MTFVDFLSQFLGDDPSGGILYSIFGASFVLICVSSILAFVFGFITLGVGGGRR